MRIPRGTRALAATTALAAAWTLMIPAWSQSGRTVSKAKEKIKAATSSSTAPAATPPATPAPAPAQTPSEPDALTVITGDPNHISAVKALEQIRRDEAASAEGTHFSYNPENRRDPFLSPQDILQAEMSGQVCQGEGMECWLIQDVTVIGVLKRRNGNVALVIGPDGYGTTLQEGDKLYDGEVRRIDPESGLVVFRQKINDPTRIKPFRDIEKGLNLNKEGRS